MLKFDFRWLFGSRSRTIRKAARKPATAKVQLQLEPLEPRLVLTARIGLANGVLRAVCDNALLDWDDCPPRPLWPPCPLWPCPCPA